jgi:hypothetical protein
MSLMSSSSKDSKQVARYQRKSPQNIKINAWKQNVEIEILIKTKG